MTQDKNSKKADKKAADASAENQIRKVVDQTAAQYQHGDNNLSEIVGKTAADADAGRTKATESFYKPHNKQAECCARKTVEEHGEITEGKRGKKNPGQRDRDSRPKTKTVQCDDDDKVCQTELDSGNHSLQWVWKESLNPTQNKGERD